MIVIIIIIIGAFLLVGGQFLLKGPGIFSVLPAPSDSGNNAGSGGGNPPVTGQPAWSIEVVNGKGSCDNTAHSYKIDVAFHGTAPGFYKIEVKNGSTYNPIYINNNIYNTFTPNGQNVQANSLTLANSDGFNTNSWRIDLYEGGTLSGNNLTGVVSQIEKDMDKTSCQ